MLIRGQMHLAKPSANDPAHTARCIHCRHHCWFKPRDRQTDRQFDSQAPWTLVRIVSISCIQCCLKTLLQSFVLQCWCSYEKSNTHRFEVPRMLFDDPEQLGRYIVDSKDSSVTVFLIFVASLFSISPDLQWKPKMFSLATLHFVILELGILIVFENCLWWCGGAIGRVIEMLSVWLLRGHWCITTLGKLFVPLCISEAV